MAKFSCFNVPLLSNKLAVKNDSYIHQLIYTPSFENKHCMRHCTTDKKSIHNIIYI